jgi:hypothetical protein
MSERRVETEMKKSLERLSWGLAGALIATGTLTGQATAAPDSEQFELRAHPGDPGAWAERIEGLESDWHLENDTVALSEVLDGADRLTPDGEACGTDDHPKTGFCWNKGDNLNQEWMPQGLTASWDAFENGRYDGRTVVAASWYLKGKNENDPARANRVSFSDRDKKSYDYIALAKPTEDGKDIEPLHLHAGGLAWVGRYLYVPDTDQGLRVFDLTHIWRADTGSSDYKVANGRVSAGGYRYVLLQVGSYIYSKKGKACSEDGAPPVHSSVSVDRKTKTLVTSEYCGDKGNGLGRIIRWPLDSNNGELTGLLNLANGKVESHDWYRTDLHSMQGVATHGDDVWMTASFGKDGKGQWYKNSLAGLETGSILPSVRGSAMCTQGPEDLTYKSDDSVWTLTEYPDERQVFPIQESNGKDCTPPG